MEATRITLKRTGHKPLEFTGRLLVAQRFMFDAYYVKNCGLYRYPGFIEFALYQTEEGSLVRAASGHDGDGLSRPTGTIHFASPVNQHQALEQIDAIHFFYTMEHMKPEPIQGQLSLAIEALMQHTPTEKRA